ncbi:MAG: hypothetical protein WEA09_11600 [Gemmatimonadota bacterium]
MADIQGFTREHRQGGGGAECAVRLMEAAGRQRQIRGHHAREV